MPRVFILVAFVLGGCQAVSQAPPPASQPASAAVPKRSQRLACQPPGQSVKAFIDATTRFGKSVQLARDPSAAKKSQAVDLLEGVIRDYPSFPHAYRGLGIVEGMRGRWPAAYTAYKRYLRFELRASDRDQVRSEMRALEKKSTALQEYAAGEQAAFAGDWQAAADRMHDVIGKKPNFSPAHRLLGIAYSWLAKPEDAVEAYEAYLKTDTWGADHLEVRQYVDAARREIARRKAIKAPLL